MLKTKLTKELITKILDIIDENNKTYTKEKALTTNKAILDLYGIPNLNGKFAYSEVLGKFYNVEVLKDLDNKENISKKYNDIDEMLNDLEG